MSTEPLDLTQFEGHTPEPWDDSDPRYPDSLILQNGGFPLTIIARILNATPPNKAIMLQSPRLLRELREAREENRQLKADCLEAETKEDYVLELLDKTKQERDALRAALEGALHIIEQAQGAFGAKMISASGMSQLGYASMVSSFRAALTQKGESQ